MTRYNWRNRSKYGTKASRLRPLLFIALIAVIVFLIIRLFGGSGLNEGNFESQRNAKIRNEMQHALSQTNALSRLGGTTTSGILGRIRQYVHGVEVMNELNVGMYGEVGRLYQQSVFDEIYSIIDAYDAKLASGQKVNDSLALLSDAIERMNTYTLQTVLER